MTAPTTISDKQAHAEAAGQAFDRCTERFPKRYRTADATDLLTLPDAKRWADEYRTNPTNARSLLLFGTVGTGKTHAAYAALRHAVTNPRLTRAHIWRAPSWLALTHADLAASIRPRPARDHNREALLTKYAEVELLLVDDLGAIKATEFVEELTYRLLNARYEGMLPTIVTSNLDVAALRESIGDRVASRLAQDCVRVVLTGPDRRRQPSIQRAA